MKPVKNEVVQVVGAVETVLPVDYSKDLEGLPTKSSKIRFLNNKGLSRGLIAKTLGIRYQHVRNVLITPIKKAKEAVIKAEVIEAVAE